jgi:hypothetical protein
MKQAHLIIKRLDIDHLFSLSSDVMIGDIFTIFVPNHNIVVERGSLKHLHASIWRNPQYPIPGTDAHYTVVCRLISDEAFNIISIEPNA